MLEIRHGRFSLKEEWVQTKKELELQGSIVDVYDCVFKRHRYSFLLLIFLITFLIKLTWSSKVMQSLLAFNQVLPLLFCHKINLTENTSFSYSVLTAVHRELLHDWIFPPQIYIFVSKLIRRI